MEKDPKSIQGNLPGSEPGPGQKERPVIYVMCTQHGKQLAVPGTVKDWGDEAAKIVGQRLITGNCSLCNGTVRVITD